MLSCQLSFISFRGTYVAGGVLLATHGIVTLSNHGYKGPCKRGDEGGEFLQKKRGEAVVFGFFFFGWELRFRTER